MPKISVIIPVYNVEKYLAECLTSVVNQTFKDIEIICVNDGSTDNSPKILEEFAQKDSRIKIINQENQGLSAARNTGLDVATGEYVSFIDSDDFVRTDLYADIQKLLPAELICFNAKIFPISEKYRTLQNYTQCQFDGEQPMEEKLILKTNVHVWNKVFRTSIIKENNIRFPKGLYFEDFPFVCEYMLSINTVKFFGGKGYYFYRQQPNSLMNNCSHKSIHHLFVWHYLYDKLKERKLLDKYPNLINKLFRTYTILAYKYSDEASKDSIIKTAQDYASEISYKGLDELIDALINNKMIYYGRKEKIFSIKNFEHNGYKDKILTLLGLQIKIKSKPIWEHRPKVLVHLHLYYLDQLDYMLKKLKNINSCDWDLFVTMTKQDEKAIQKLKDFKPDVHIIQVEDKGFDIWPFLQVLNLVDLDNYDDILKIHTKKYRKKKDFYGRGNAWRNYLIDALLGSRKQFQKNIHLMQMDKSVGLIGSRATLATMGCTEKDDSILFDEMCQNHGIPISKGRFIAGTMFLVRAKCFQRIKDMNFKSEDFHHIQQTSGRTTTAHTLERLLSRIVEIEGYKITTVRSWKYSSICTIRRVLKTIFSISNLPRKSENEPKTKVITILGLKFTRVKK